MAIVPPLRIVPLSAAAVAASMPNTPPLLSTTVPELMKVKLRVTRN